MKLLLPHKFKKVGAVIAPLGFGLWVGMQMGYVDNLLQLLPGQSMGDINSTSHFINVAVAVISFFSFLAGIFFVTFSKEKIEDEMVQRTRLDSFQFAALIQIIFILCGFLFILFAGDPGESGMMLFFISLVFLFWLSFIARFNYVLHISLKQ